MKNNIYTTQIGVSFYGKKKYHISSTIVRKIDKVGKTPHYGKTPDEQKSKFEKESE